LKIFIAKLLFAKTEHHEIAPYFSPTNSLAIPPPPIYNQYISPTTEKWQEVLLI